MNQDVMEPPKKKLKQACLPFLNSPSQGSSKSPKIVIEKKRKASDELNELRTAKTVRRVSTPEKENVAVPKAKGIGKDLNEKTEHSNKKTDILKIVNNINSDVINLDSSDSESVNLESVKTETDDTNKKTDVLKTVNNISEEAVKCDLPDEVVEISESLIDEDSCEKDPSTKENNLNKVQETKGKVSEEKGEIIKEKDCSVSKITNEDCKKNLVSEITNEGCKKKSPTPIIKPLSVTKKGKGKKSKIPNERERKSPEEKEVIVCESSKEKEETVTDKRHGSNAKSSATKVKLLDKYFQKELPNNKSTSKKIVSETDKTDNVDQKEDVPSTKSSQESKDPPSNETNKSDKDSKEMSSNDTASDDEDCLNDSLNSSNADGSGIITLESTDEDSAAADKSILSTPETPLAVSDSSEAKNALTKPSPHRKLTPKQLLRREIAQKKKDEAERIRKEKKQQKAKRIEEKKKLRAAEEEQKKHVKEEKKRQRLLELEEKNEQREKKREERKKREEEKLQKIEEKKKKKEEKIKEEEQKEEAKKLEKIKEEQSKAVFASFFKPKQQRKSENQLSAEVKCVDSNERCIFMPFPVKSDMRLAAVKRRVLNESQVEELDKYLQSQLDSVDKLYIKSLKSSDHKPATCLATWPCLDDQHDVIIVESVKENVDNFDNDCFEVKPSNQRKPYRAKLLQFHENRRPAFWGTWRKKSLSISPKTPFRKDEKYLDYEVDSDSEWEDEEEGENIEDVEGDKESEDEPEEQTGGENGYILDKQFVPHGYLSDEEANDREEDITPEAQKLRLTELKEEFDEEMKQKTERLKPRMLGIVWISNRTTEVPKGILYETLMQHRCVWDDSVHSIDLYGEPLYESPSSTPSSAKGKTLSPEVEAALVKFVHGTRRSLVNLVRDFVDHASQEFPDQKIRKSFLGSKIRELFTKVHNAQGKLVWSVKNELCSTYNVTSVVDATPKLSTPPATIKQKETALTSFLSKGTSTPVKKRVSLTPATTPPTVGTEKTPISVKSSIPKKKVSLISLPHTPQIQRKPVHKDTPHPSFKIVRD